VYLDEMIDDVREQLQHVDGVLVWVDPIAEAGDRSKLDPMLRDLASQGIWVSAHPDTILKMGTKEVLVDTASMSWGTETRLYRTAEELRDELPERLTECGPLVLKQHRGMGGSGVWRVESDGLASVRVQHAAKGSVPERLSLEQFLRRCEPYFAGTGLMV
jgi:glutathione synthase/RimK-type ligase-like ATP-grasp enzyme